MVNPQRVHAVRESMRLQLALALHDDWQWAYAQHECNGAYQPDALQRAPRPHRHGAVHAVPGGAHTGDTVWPGKTLQRFKMRAT